jgi:small subunit ribosomal protein S2
MESSGEINALSKRERLSIRRELDKLQQTLGGVREMTRVPEAIFIVDVNTEHTAVKEAKRLGITTLALVDSNCDPDHIDFVIAGNDDAIRAASTVAGALAEAAREGRELAGKKIVPAKGEKARDGEAPARERPAMQPAATAPTSEQPAPEQPAPEPAPTPAPASEPPVSEQSVAEPVVAEQAAGESPTPESPTPDSPGDQPAPDGIDEEVVASG